LCAYSSLSCMPHDPSTSSFQRIRSRQRPYVTLRNNLVFFTVKSCWSLAQLPSWRTTLCRPSATAYSIYSQLHSTSGDCILQPQPAEAPRCGDRNTHEHVYVESSKHNWNTDCVPKIAIFRSI
jgi:hypothetical protein